MIVMRLERCPQNVTIYPYDCTPLKHPLGDQPFPKWYDAGGPHNLAVNAPPDMFIVSCRALVMRPCALSSLIGICGNIVELQGCEGPHSPVMPKKEKWEKCDRARQPCTPRHGSPRNASHIARTAFLG